MANIVNATVADRVIAVGDTHDPLVSGNVGRDYCKATFDSEWTGLAIRATFACGKQAVTVDYDTDETDGVEIPHEVLVPGSLRLSFVGIGEDGEEVLRTAHMRNGVPVKAAGADMGSEAAERTMDVAALAKQRMDTLESQLPNVTAATSAANTAATAASRVNATLSGTTLTVTDRNGTSTSVDTKGATGAAGRDGRDGVDGTNGADGADGYSPQAVVEQTANGATIYITDADGTTTATISNGTTPTIDPHAITLQGMTQGAAWTASEQAAARGRIGAVVPSDWQSVGAVTLEEASSSIVIDLPIAPKAILAFVSLKPVSAAKGINVRLKNGASYCGNIGFISSVATSVSADRYCFVESYIFGNNAYSLQSYGAATNFQAGGTLSFGRMSLTSQDAANKVAFEITGGATFGVGTSIDLYYQ